MSKGGPGWGLPRPWWCALQSRAQQRDALQHVRKQCLRKPPGALAGCSHLLCTASWTVSALHSTRVASRLITVRAQTQSS